MTDINPLASIFVDQGLPLSDAMGLATRLLEGILEPSDRQWLQQVTAAGKLGGEEQAMAKVFEGQGLPAEDAKNLATRLFTGQLGFTDYTWLGQVIEAGPHDPNTGAPGPPTRAGGPGQLPSDMFQTLNPGAQAMLKQVVDTFLGDMGWPNTLDEQTLLNWLVSQGNWDDSQAAAQALYASPYVSKDLRAAKPWAAQGLDAVTYHKIVADLSSKYFDLTGIPLSPSQISFAFAQNITTGAQLQDAVFANPSWGWNTAKNETPRPFPDEPWLATGQSYLSVKQAYVGKFGTQPTDLAAYFRFNQGLQSIGTGPAASYASPKPQGTMTPVGESTTR